MYFLEDGPGPNEHLGGNDFGPGLLMNKQCQAIFEPTKRSLGFEASVRATKSRRLRGNRTLLDFVRKPGFRPGAPAHTAITRVNIRTILLNIIKVFLSRYLNWIGPLILVDWSIPIPEVRWKWR